MALAGASVKWMHSSINRFKPMSRTRRIYCNTCGVETNHRLGITQQRYVSTPQLRQLYFVEEVRLDEPLRFDEDEAVLIYNLWTCQGCGTATLQEACTARTLVSDNGLQARWTYDFHPTRLKDSWQRKPFSMPLTLSVTYWEVIESFNAGLITLCAIGLRALLEGICVDKGITDEVAWGLGEKIDKLGEHGYVPSQIANSLKSFKIIGDSAAYRLEVPEPEDLKLAIEVMEGLLTFLYSLDWKAQCLSERIQER
jgi:hypothetical protein